MRYPDLDCLSRTINRFIVSVKQKKSISQSKEDTKIRSMNYMRLTHFPHHHHLLVICRNAAKHVKPLLNKLVSHIRILFKLTPSRATGLTLFAPSPSHQ